MKSTFSLFLFLGILSNSVILFGQKSSPPTIAQLQKWADTKSHSDFSFEIRKLGYKFIEIDTTYSIDTTTKLNKEIIAYVYHREISIEGKGKYLDNLMYRVTPSVEIGISIQYATVASDLFAFYENNLKNNFKETKCYVKDNKNETSFCYFNSKYTIRIIDERIKIDENETNSHTIVLYRTK